MPIIPRSPSSGSTKVPQYNTNPVNPSAGDQWILATGLVGSPGQAMGPMGIPYAGSVVQSFAVVLRTEQNSNIVLPAS